MGNNPGVLSDSSLLVVLWNRGDGDRPLTQRVPRSGTFKAPYMNDHSGRHYNVEFNRFWARQMLEILDGAGVFAQ